MNHDEQLKRFDDIRYNFKEVEWKMNELIKRINDLEVMAEAK